MPLYKLSRHVKFRKETDHILVCDCKRLLNYQLPLEYFDLLTALKGGYDPASVIGYPNESDVIDDFTTAQFIHELGNEPANDRGPEDIWSRLAYKGPEQS